MDFGGGPLDTAETYDAFTAKLDAGGEHVWSQLFGDDEQQQALCVAVDRWDHVLAGGHFQGSIDFGAGPKGAVDRWDGFAVKLLP